MLSSVVPIRTYIVRSAHHGEGEQAQQSQTLAVIRDGHKAAIDHGRVSCFQLF